MTDIGEEAKLHLVHLQLLFLFYLGAMEFQPLLLTLLYIFPEGPDKKCQQECIEDISRP